MFFPSSRNSELSTASVGESSGCYGAGIY